jgi:nitronate monooxygenase
MALRTPFTERLVIEHPLALAPMGGVSGGVLAAAVSNAGALGMVGGGYGDPAWVERELKLVKAATAKPWGVGFITWSLKRPVLERALEFEPAAVMLSFGDPVPWAPVVKDSGRLLICQVQDLATAAAAVEAGADVIVAQGTEAGGHTGARSTFSLVPAVVDLVAPIPVLAAGGIADGRGLAAALALGAQGALVGTRFYATPEALGHEGLKAEITRRSGDDTVRTSFFDEARGYDWPAGYAGRAIRNELLAKWGDAPKHARAHRHRLQAANAAGDAGQAMIWAGEGIDLIDDVRPAAEVVHMMVAQAQAVLRRYSP